MNILKAVAFATFSRMDYPKAIAFYQSIRLNVAKAIALPNPAD